MTKNFLRSFLSVLAVLTLWAGGTAAAAPKPSAPKVNPIGNDISWPQCGKTLPTNQAFGIVGVNGGLASTTNTCLSEQLLWAQRSTGAAAGQDKVQLYVNTANPGELIADPAIVTWPDNNTDRSGFVTENPYQQCEPETNSLACSWQYGWNRAYEAVNERFAPAVAGTTLDKDPAAYIWWLDVETENTWQSGSVAAYQRNVATLEGMTAYYRKLGARVGIYSTGYQWRQIVGQAPLPSGSNLNGLPSWLAGARNQSTARQNCSLAPLVSGSKVVLTQYVSGGLDYDVACPV